VHRSNISAVSVRRVGGDCLELGRGSTADRLTSDLQACVNGGTLRRSVVRVSDDAVTG
jgi:hypothetical protein